jgi:hypothetical protein
MTWTAASRRHGQRSLGVRLWRATAGVTLGLGVVCALLVWGREVWVYVLVSCGLLALLLASHVESQPVRRPIRTTGAAVVGVTAAAGLVTALGWFGLTLLVLVTASHPAVVRTLWRVLEPGSEQETTRAQAQHPDVAASLRGDQAATAAGTSGLPEAASVQDLDDESLCQAWRRSFVHLATCRLPSRRLEIVHLRQLYLDELDRRHPAAVQRWLTSGARAASNPMPFVERPHGDLHDNGQEGL